MFYWKTAQAAFRLTLLVGLLLSIVPSLSTSAQERPAPQAQAQALSFSRSDSVTGAGRPSAPRSMDARPLLDAWRAAGQPADASAAAIATPAVKARVAAAQRNGAAPAQDIVVQFTGSVTKAVASGPLTGLVFLVYYSAETGYFPVDFYDLSNGAGYLLGSPFHIPADPRDGFTNEVFEIWYLNTSLSDESLDPSQLYKVYGPYYDRNTRLTSLVSFDSFDVSDVVLGAPGGYAREDGSSEALVEFNWQPRFTGEYYQICIYDPLTLEAGTDEPIILCSTAFNDDGTLHADALNKQNFSANLDSFPADYPFLYNQPYYWFVRSYELSTTGAPFASGTSFYENTIVFLEAAEPEPPPPAEPGGGIGGGGAQTPWTVLVYMAADNELGDLNRLPNPESNIKRQWESLVSIAPNYASTITIVTYTDFYNDGSTKICNISVNPAQCEERGEKNSSDPAELQNFVSTALNSYPAENTMLIFATHGHGVVGVGFDQSVADDAAVMTPNQVRKALVDAGVGSSLPKFDIIFYNACLMATLEVAADSAPFADYLVASSNILWVVNIYQELLDTIVAQASAPAEVAKGIVTAYTNRVASKVSGGVYSNLAAFDLAKVGPLVGAVSNLGTALDGALASETTPATKRSLINAARSAAQVYDSSGNNLLDSIYDDDGKSIAREEDAFVDIRHFAQLVVNGGPAEATDEAQAVIAATNNGFIIASQQKSGPNGPGGANLAMDNASGFGVYFPNGSMAGRQATYNQAYLFDRNFETYNATSNWDNFLRTYINATIGQAPGSVGRRGDPIAGNVITYPTYIPMLLK